MSLEISKHEEPKIGLSFQERGQVQLMLLAARCSSLVALNAQQAVSSSALETKAKIATEVKLDAERIREFLREPALAGEILQWVESGANLKPKGSDQLVRFLALPGLESTEAQLKPFIKEQP